MWPSFRGRLICVSKGGAQKTAPHFDPPVPGNSPQATAVWTWCNFLHEQVGPGLTPLRVNFDETAIRHYQDRRRGCLTLSAVRERRTPRSLTRPATRATTRAMMSLCAFVCDDPVLQVRLPQVLVVNERLTSAVEAAAIRSELPEGMVLWRQPRCWTTAETMGRLLRLLGEALEPVRASHQVILSFDAFRAHLAPKVWRAAAREGFLVFVIPARMTWVLQPCDTHVFALFKRRLEEAAQAEAAATPHGEFSQRLLARAVAKVVGEVIRGRSWTRAFEHCGLTGSQAALSARTLAKLGAHPGPAGSHLPTLEMLQEVFPARANIPIDDVFRPFLPTRAAPALRGDRRRPERPPSPEPGRPPWRGRLRSFSALALREQPAATSSAVCPPPASRPPLPDPVGRLLFPFPRAPPPPPAEGPEG